MFVTETRRVLKRRLRRPLRFGLFERHPLLFYGAIVLMLGFFAIAAVHEWIPGLCKADAEGEDECPFCKLVHTLLLVAVAAACFAPWSCTAPRAQGDFELPPLTARFPAYLLRAPPAI